MEFDPWACSTLACNLPAQGGARHGRLFKSNLTRRTFLKGGGVATAAAVGLTIIVRSARAKSDTLKIGQWTHFVPWVAPISLGTIGWKWMLDSLYRPVNWVLQALHMGFFKSIPKDIEEAAMVDGCGRARAIVQIIMPISLAGILSAVIFAFTLTIKEFTYALTLITSRGQQTVGGGADEPPDHQHPGGDPLQPLPRALHLGLHRGRDQVVALRPRKNGLPGHLQHDIRLRLDELLFQLVTAEVRHHVVPCRAKDGFHHLELAVGVVARLYARTNALAGLSE